MGYLTALTRCDLRGYLDYVDRNLIEKWFQTLSMRIDRVSSNVDGRKSQRCALVIAFVYYYNTQRPKQALDDRTPAAEVMN